VKRNGTIKMGKYAVRKPIYEAGPGVKGRQSPTMTFMSEKQVSGVPYYIELAGFTICPTPIPYYGACA
jgi:hypothetical protein